MYKLIVKRNNLTILEKNLTQEDFPIKGMSTGISAEFIVTAFKVHIGLDINQYRLDEWDGNEERFILHIREEDLVKLRDDKLNLLGL